MFAATLFSSLRRNRAKKSPRGLLVRGRPLAVEPLEDRTLLSVVQLNPVSHLSGYAGPQVQQSVSVSPRGPTLPSSYDLRTLNDVTSVKDQGSYGTCWTFATYGSLESSILMAGGPTTDFSEANLANTAGFDWGPNDGGNSYMSEAYLSRYSGPINESADPYSNVDQPDSVSGPVQDYVREMLRFDTTVNSIDQIKTAIMTDGALYTTMYMDPAYYDSASYTYYYNGKAATNHAVTVVGWDDNKVTAGGTGAWLIKNSWGTSWGDGGYFWLSYQDAAACKTFESFGSAASASSVSEDYNWASFGDVGEISASYAMSAFTADANSLLKSAGFFTEADNAAYTVSVYSTFSGGQLSGLLATTSGTEAYAGWHTVDLPSSLSLAPATKFYLSVSLTNGGSYPTAISYAAPGYDSSCTASPGHSYYSSDGTTWTDLTTLQPTDSACIAALTVVTTPPTVTSPNITLSGASGTGGTFRTGDTVTATWNNSASGDNDPGITAATMDFSQFGGGSSVAAVDHGDFWTATYKITQGSIDGANASVLVTATNAAGATTTAGPSALVDNQPPVVSDAFITIISTGSGPNGSYRAGDRLTIEWDNSASGDHNTDLASSNPVTVDFSQFGGSSTVAASDNSDFWTASSTITAFSPTSQSVVVTATDQAGNVTKTSYTTSLTVTPVATTTAISLSSQAITYGQSDTFTANVQAAGLSSSSLVGSVQFYVDGAAVGPANPLVLGKATWTDPLVTAGNHSVYAVYTSGSPALFSSSHSSLASLGVAKAMLTVAADAKTMVYGAPVPTLSYTVTAGWVGPGPSTLVSPPALFTAGKSTSPVGQYTIFVYGGFDPNYTFTYVTGKLTISPAVLTITAQSSTMVYGSGALPNLGVSYSGLANGDLSWQVLATSPVVTTVAKAGSHAGSYPIIVSGATLKPNANYTLNYVSGTLTITPAPLLISASPATMVYGGTSPILQWSVTGLVNGDTRAIIITPPTLSGVSSGLHVGNYAITPSGAVITPVSAGDYTIAYATAALTVTPANLILKADDETVVYGTTPVPPSFHVIGLVGGATLASIEDPTPYFYGPDLQYADGTYPQPGTPVNESQLKTQPATADLPYPAPSVTLEVPDFSNVGVYRDAIDFRNTSSDATNHYGGPGDYLNDGSVGDIIYNPDEWYRSYNYWAASGSGSPQWTVVNPATGLPDPHAGGMLREAKNVNGLLDYNITYQPGTLTIVPATLNVVVDSQDMTYGGPLPYFSYSYSGLVNSDTLTSITGGPSLDSFAQYTMATSLSNAGVYQIGQPFTSANPNYVVNFVPGTLTIDPATLYITANDQWLTYGQIAIAPQPDGSVLYEMPDQSQYTVSGLVNGDLATPNLVATDYHAGQAAIYVAGVQITGNGTAADYVINTTPGIATILPAPLTITTLDQTLTYGDVVVVNSTTFALPNDTVGGLASQISVTGWQYSDNLSSLSALPTLTTDSYHANADALGNLTGPAYTIYADGAGLSDDYTVQYVNSGQLTILPAPLTISPVDVGDKTSTIETTYGVNPDSRITYAGGENWYTTPVTTLSGLSAPSAMAFDGSGNLYVVNSGTNTVSVFAPDGTLASTLTGLNGPVALAVDDSGDVVVGNSDGTVSVFDAGSTTPKSYPLPYGGMPSALLFDPTSGNLYVADSHNGCVYEADSSANILSVLTGVNGAPLNSPDALAFDPLTGRLYVANAGDGTVSVFGPASLAQATATPDITLTLPSGSVPSALFFDQTTGHLYVADKGNGCVYEFAPGSTTPDGNLTRTGFSDPTSVSVDAVGNLYVANYGSGSGTTVSVFTPGSTTACATYAGLNGPAALALDQGGNLCVANQGGTTVSVFVHPTSQLKYSDTLDSLGIVPNLAWSASNGSAAVGTEVPSSLLTSGVTGPLAVAVDDTTGLATSGNRYVANSDGTVSVFAAGSTTPTATLNLVYNSDTPYVDALTVGRNGDLFVLDYANGIVGVFPEATLAAAMTSGTAAATYFLGNVSGSSQLAAPTSLALDYGGGGSLLGLFVANSGLASNTVSVFKAPSLTANNPPDYTLNLPSSSVPGINGMAFDPVTGDLYVADDNPGLGDTVSVFSHTAISAQLGQSSGTTLAYTSQLSLPAGSDPYTLAFDGSGNLYVGNLGAFNSVDANVSKFTASAGGALNSPPTILVSHATDSNFPATAIVDALICDSQGNLYAADSGGAVWFFAGAGGPEQSFSTDVATPMGLALDTADNFYVANLLGGTGGSGSVSEYYAPGSLPPQPTDSGSYPISAMAGVPDPQPFVTDYTIDYGTANLVINKAPLTLTTYLTLDGVNPASDVPYHGTDYNQQYDPSTGTGYLTYLAGGLQYSDQLSSLADSNGGFDDLSGLTVSTNPMPAVHAGGYTVNFDYPPDQDPSISLENYTLTCLSGSFTIDPATLTITAADQYQDANGNPLVYGGTQPDLMASAQTVSVIGLAPTDTFDYGQLTLSTDDTVNPFNDLYHAGQYTITVSGPDFGPDYTTVYQPGVLMIQQAQLTITATQATPLQYGQLDPGHLASEVTYTPSGLATNDSLDNLYVGGTSTGISGDLTVSTDATTSLSTGYYNAGPADLFVDGPSETEDYTITYDVGALQIDQASLTIQALDQIGLTYGDPDTAPSASNFTVMSEGSNVRGNGLVAALPGSGLTGDTLTNLGVMSEVQLTINDTVSGAGFYHAIDDVASGLTSISVEPISPPLILANYTINPTTGYLSGKLQISPASASSGLTITAASQTGLTYGGAPPDLTPSTSTVTVTGLLPGDTIDYSKLVLSTSNVLNPYTGSYHAGTYQIHVAPGTSGSPEPDYTITYDTLPGTLQISKATLTISGSANQPYGVLKPSNLASYVNYTPAGIVLGDTLGNLYVGGKSVGITGGLNPTTPDATINSSNGYYNAGLWHLNVTGPSSTDDYVITTPYPVGTLEIDQVGLSVTPKDLEKTYGVLNPSNLASYVTYTLKGLVPGDTISSIGLASLLTPWSPSATTNLSNPNNWYNASGPSGWQLDVTGPSSTQNYQSITYGSGTLTIDQATLGFVADDKQMTYGATSLPPLTYHHPPTGLANGDTESAVVLTPPTLSTNAHAATPPGSGSHVSGSPYTISIGGAVLTTNSGGIPNYIPQYVSGALTVNRAPLTITADSKWMLQGTSPASLPLTVSYATLVNGDTAANLTTPPTITTTATSASPLGSYPITVGGAADPDYTISYVSGVLTVATTNNSVYLIPDPLNPGQSILYIWGTNGNDTIMVAPGTNPNSVSVIMNGVFRGAFGSASQPISRIVAHGIAGRDSIAVSQNVTIPAWLYGDNGTADNLSGGGGPTYLFGGVGANTLVGGKGRSILIGGAGNGSLAGGSGDAILIGGTTAYNPATLTDTTKDAALLAILNEWSNTAEGYATRAGHLLGTLPGGLNGPYDLIAGSTVFGNSAIDKLVGSSTATDLFFMSAHDTLNGQHAGELPPISV